MSCTTRTRTRTWTSSWRTAPNSSNREIMLRVSLGRGETSTAGCAQCKALDGGGSIGTVGLRFRRLRCFPRALHEIQGSRFHRVREVQQASARSRWPAPARHLYLTSPFRYQRLRRVMFRERHFARFQSFTNHLPRPLLFTCIKLLFQMLSLRDLVVTLFVGEHVLPEPHRVKFWSVVEEATRLLMARHAQHFQCIQCIQCVQSNQDLMYSKYPRFSMYPVSSFWLMHSMAPSPLPPPTPTPTSTTASTTSAPQSKQRSPALVARRSRFRDACKGGNIFCASPTAS